MLVLARQREEETVLTVLPSSEPTIIKTVIVDIRGCSVRTGYEAPRGVTIHRKEVYDAIMREGRDPVSVTPAEVAEISRSEKAGQHP